MSPSSPVQRVSYKWVVLVGAEVLLLWFNDIVVAGGRGGGLALVVSLSKDVVLAVLVMAALPRLIRGSSRLAALVLSLGAFALMSTLFAPSLAQGMYGFRNSYAGLFWLMVLPKLIRAVDARSLLLWVSYTGQAAAVAAIATHRRGIAWLFELDVLPVADGDPFPHSYFLSGSLRPRAFSPFVGPNELALAMLVVIVSVWCNTNASRRFRVLLTLLPATALLLSGSRSGLLGASVALGIVAVRALPQRAFAMRTGISALMFAATGLAAVVYLGQGAAPDPSLEGHRSSLVQSVAMITADPVGSGTGTVGPRALLYDADAVLTESFILLVGLELGIVGIVLYIAVLQRTFDRLRSRRTSVATASLAVLGGSLVSQVVLPTMQSTSVAWLVWIVVGLGLTTTFTPPAALPRVLHTPQRSGVLR